MGLRPMVTKNARSPKPPDASAHTRPALRTDRALKADQVGQWPTSPSPAPRAQRARLTERAHTAKPHRLARAAVKGEGAAHSEARTRALDGEHGRSTLAHGASGTLPAKHQGTRALP